MDTYFVRRDNAGTVVCTTCTGFKAPATHVATYEKTDGSGPGAWALCATHAPLGLLAWGALTPLADFEAQQAPTGDNHD